jgi:RHS repeat-associated protein
VFGTQLWTAYDGANGYADFSGQTLTTRYLFGNGPDELVARTNATGNSTAWYLTDDIGSARQIVDASGNNLYRVNYFTFGGIVPGSESGTGGDRFKFARREWDSEVGLYYNRARVYDPNAGRFLSEDPIGFDSQDTNLYRYVRNNPLTFKDPFGLDRFWIKEPIQTAKDIWGGVQAWWNTPGSSGAVGGAATGAGIGAGTGAAGAAVVVLTVAVCTATPIGWAGGVVILVGAGLGALTGGSYGAEKGNGKTGSEGAAAAAGDPWTWEGPFIIGALAGIRMYKVVPDGPFVDWPW